MTELATQLAAYQGNAWTPVLEALAEDLGVSANALARLGVGFAPTVAFDKYHDYRGWWAIPERDATGKVVGIALRDSNDGKNKVMLPGSKHGLTYEYTGASAKSSRVHYIRVRDTDTVCPMCGDDDGCLLSDDDVDDPARVICVRESDGSTETKDNGWLHIRKILPPPSSGPLPSGDPVIVVEGMTDTAAAMTIGLVAIGRPSAVACLPMVAAMCQGRNIVVVGENDKGAGMKGMKATADAVNPTAASVRYVLPPAGIKDLRAWVKAGLTKDILLGFVEEHGKTPDSGDEVLESEAPTDIANQWLNDRQIEDGILGLRWYRGQWMQFRDYKYVEVDERTVVRKGLYNYLHGRTVLKPNNKGQVLQETYEPTRVRVGDVIDALAKWCPVEPDPPAWLTEEDRPDPRGLICFANGYLELDRWAGGEVELINPTAELFMTTALPYNFDPDAACPKWMAWLGETFEDDPDKVALLQEWFGYCLAPDMSREKFMLFKGRPRSGKSTTLTMLTAVLGREQVATVSFSDLADQNGLHCLVGKLAALMPDARLPQRGNASAALEMLLGIVGQDGVNIKRKYLGNLTNHQLSCRFTIAVNELPELPDHSQALEPRLLVLDFAQCFMGREDVMLKLHLPREAPGVILWALEGLRRLRENGQFTEPKSSVVVKREFRRVTSSIVEFSDECCLLNEDTSIVKEEFYDAWMHWAKEKGIRPGGRTQFGQRLTSALPAISTGHENIDGRSSAVYRGVSLRGWAQERYLGRPA